MPQLVKSLEGDKLVSAFRILKLTWRGLFDPSIYTNRIQIAQGAFAQVSPQGFSMIEDKLIHLTFLVGCVCGLLADRMPRFSLA